MGGDNVTAREAAMLALESVERGGAYGGEAVGRQIRRRSGGEPVVTAGKNKVNVTGGLYGDYTDEGGAPPASGNYGDRDEALLRELVYGVTKWKLTLDSIIFSYSKLKRQKISSKILTILRLGTYQIAFLDKIPVSAACDESVKLAKKYGNEGSARFVNAVLRKIASGGEGDPRARYAGAAPAINNAGSPRETDAGYLSVRFSYPPWLCHKWLERYGPEFAAALMEAGNRKPEFTIRVNSVRAQAPALAEMLRARVFEVKPGHYSRNALIIGNPGRFSDAPEFKGGLFSVQGESSMLAVEALSPKPGEKILDVCAAPGGKSAYIAELTNDSADITAADVRPRRIALMEQNLGRLGLKSISCVNMDALVYDARYANSMDRVLVDAPCSGFGVIWKKPEIKWLRQPEDITDIAKLQYAILANASRYVKPGGVMVYGVCTTEQEECGDVVRLFLNGPGAGAFEACGLGESLPPAVWAAAPRNENDPGIYLYPHIHGADGFYIARLKRI